MKKCLKKDITIPAGTVFENVDGVERKYVNGFFETSLGLTKGSCGSLTYGVDPSDPDLDEWFEDMGERHISIKRLLGYFDLLENFGRRELTKETTTISDKFLPFHEQSSIVKEAVLIISEALNITTDEVLEQTSKLFLRYTFME